MFLTQAEKGAYFHNDDEKPHAISEINHYLKNQ